MAGSQCMVSSKPIVGDMGKSHRVFAVVDNYQAEHQAIIIEATCMIRGSSVTVDS